MRLNIRLLAVVMCVLVLTLAREARAHCDTLSGPVVSAARLALRTNDVTPALKWVRDTEEAEVRAAFRRTTAVRGLSPAAGELADQFFFETLVRLHRLGEGEPYRGLQSLPEIDEAVDLADTAVMSGDVEPLARFVTERVTAGVRERFARVRDLKRYADDSVAAGRRYVAAYVDFIHFVEALPRESAVDPEGGRH